MDDVQSSALFSVRRSVMYHSRRLGFFELLQRVTAILTVSVAGFVFIDISGGQLADGLRWLAFFAGLFAIFDFVVGYSQRADLHRRLRREFCELEVEMALADEGDQNAWKELRAKRLRIEVAEPPIYRALDLQCHNALMAANGYRLENAEHREYFRKLAWYYRLTAQVWRWDNIANDPKILYPAPRDKDHDA